jgi:hypothetical protein
MDGPIFNFDDGLLTIKIDSEFSPNRNDKVEIGRALPGLDFFDANALGMVREVTGDLVVVKVFATFEPIESFHVARITSDRPARRGQSSPASSGASTAKGNRVVTFDDLPAGDLASDTLARFGIAAVQTAEGSPLVYQASPAQVLPEGRRKILSAGSASTRMSTLTFMFANPLRRFELVRIGVINGGSLPKWKMEALDREGKVVAAAGEGEWGFDQKPKQFSVTGRGIVSVRIEADNRWGNATFATYSALPIVELRLEADVETAARRVPANSAWTPTRLMLKPGDSVEISASGTVEAARADERAFYHQVSPDGRNERFAYLPQSDLPALVLMGRIDNGPAFAVGRSMRLKVGH